MVGTAENSSFSLSFYFIYLFFFYLVIICTDSSLSKCLYVEKTIFEMFGVRIFVSRWLYTFVLYIVCSCLFLSIYTRVLINAIVSIFYGRIK